MPIDHDRFLQMLAEEFPDVAANMMEISKGLLHMEMADFARATTAALQAGSTTTAQRHFMFAANVFADADPQVKNALYTSYLENIFIGAAPDVYAQAHVLLPQNLQKALTELELHFKKIFPSPDGNSPAS